MQSVRSGLEPADFVEAFFFQCGDCDAFFFADWGTAFEFLAPIPRFEVRGVEVHIRQYRNEYEGQGDVDDLDGFHAALDGENGLWGNLLLASSLLCYSEIPVTVKLPTVLSGKTTSYI
jgi:hypothetical protein